MVSELQRRSHHPMAIAHNIAGDAGLLTHVTGCRHSSRCEGTRTEARKHDNVNNKSRQCACITGHRAFDGIAACLPLSSLFRSILSLMYCRSQQMRRVVAATSTHFLFRHLAIPCESPFSGFENASPLPCTSLTLPPSTADCFAKNQQHSSAFPRRNLEVSPFRRANKQVIGPYITITLLQNGCEGL